MASPHSKLTRDVTDVAIGSPFVALSRVAGFMMPGAIFSARARTEWVRMVLEKQTAFMESVLAMAASGQRQAMHFWLNAAFMQPLSPPTEREVIDSTRAALKPYRSRVNANVRRMAKRTARS